MRLAKNTEKSPWQQSGTGVFWAELASCNHVVQMYENDKVLLDLLEGYVTSGIAAGDCMVIIATKAHLHALEVRLKAHGFSLFELTLTEQYIALDADETLSEFMVDGRPDKYLFNLVVTKLVVRARKNNRKVRAFGEMVALLWKQGQRDATLELEHLWNNFAETESFSLFCAYPKGDFTQDANTCLQHICGAHTKLITCHDNDTSQVFYKDVDPGKAG